VHLRHLSVVDFRSWPSAELALLPGPVALVGPNGHGKTNLLEAVGYLATLGSHRAGSDAPLVREGAERAVIRAAVVAHSAPPRELRVEVEIVPGRANRAKLGNAAVPRARDVLGAVRSVLFAPEDLAVVKGDPAERRGFLDELLVTRRPRLAAVRADYERVLKQRSTLLKTAGAARRGTDAHLGALDAWDAQLAAHGAELMHARLTTVRDLRPHLAAAWHQLAAGAQSVGAEYRTSLAEQLPALREPTGADTTPDVDQLRDALAEQISRTRPAELERGVNLVGPHRDDLDLRLAGLPARSHASQGESWSIAIALRLASFELLRADDLPAGDPVLLLDDVFAHLDDERREQLALVASKAEQALVTAAAPHDVPSVLHGQRFRVADGKVVPDE
jgi:DNA replication and repair protein RecF